MRRAIAILVCLVGFGAAASAMSSMASPGFLAGPISFAKLLTVATRMLVLLFGAGIVAFGFMLAKDGDKPGEERHGLSTALMLAAWSFAFTAISAVLPRAHVGWVLLGYVAAASVILPAPLGLATLVAAGSLHFALTAVSAAKSSLTGLPLTMLDFRIALGDPLALWESLGLPQWSRYLAMALVAAVALAWAIAAGYSVRGLFTRNEKRLSGAAATRLGCFCIVALLTYAHFQVQHAKAAEDASTWLPQRMTRLANRIGIIPYLTFSYGLEMQFAGDIHRLRVNVAPPSTEEVREAVRGYISVPGAAGRLLPNVVIVLAESTFDPGSVFRLHGSWNDQLFRHGPGTVTGGTLRVNDVGGGTWITEFETIVGLDARIFGYSGMYTHASLSPFIRHSFATYLRQRGYRTVAFFPNRGNFYNARDAYAHYGFDTVFDAEDLAGSNWIGNDQAIADAVRSRLGTLPESPFLAYVLTLENHAPHECRAAGPADFPARFVDTADFEPNCALNEYLRRLDSTAAAVALLLDYLAGVEERSGRPYLMLVFGDHQPYTFTDSGGVLYDYTSLRKDPDDRNATFFHIYSSEPAGVLNCCEAAPPASLLPTLLSAYVATTTDDVYLGLNLWLYSRCESDAVGRDFGRSLQAMKPRASGMRTESCDTAYWRALAGYRESGVFSFDRSQGRPAP